MSEAKIEEIVCEDRISELPEDLLVTILSLVPIKDAVVTMILSKRWSSIWTMLTTLKYKDSNKNNDDESKKSIWWFLDKSLQSHKAHVINSLSIKVGPRCPTDADVGKWVAKAVDRHVAILNLRLQFADPTSLPMSLYTCETLVELTLSHNILVDFPSSACLPSLFKLRMSFVMYKDDASLARFLLSCPALEALLVERKKDDNVTNFSVKVPSLRHFWYMNRSRPDDNDVKDTDRCLVIDTPKLITFSIIDYSGDSCSVENNMPRLKNAYIHVESSLDSDKLISSFSNVLSLELFFSKEVVKRCCTINFSRLKMLEVYPIGSDWLKPIMLLLGNAPNLKTLIVNCIFIDNFEDITLSWNQPSSVPICLSSQLQVFEWTEYGNSIEEDEFLTYVFANSKCLKTATISLSPTVQILEDQDLIFEELKDIPRVSTASQLLLK